MGNAQSNSRSNSNRLSKPKTNTNSPNGTPKTASPVSVCSKYADIGITRIQQLKSQVSSPTKSKFSSGYSYDGDDGIGELASHVQVRLSSISRSNSVASQQAGPSSNTKLASLSCADAIPASQNQGVDLDTALKILQEVRKSTSPADLASLHEALQTSSPALNQSPTTRSPDTNRSSLSLIRRRSLLATPGLATRHSVTDATRRSWNSWKTRNTGTLDNKCMTGSSPLARLPSIGLTEDGESNTQRARTPGDMEYSHLGSLKLGSLVVTNGAPSPAVSARKVSRRVSHSDLAQEDDYFTASEGSGSPTMWKSGRKWNHSRSKSSVLPQTPPIHSERRRPERNKKNKTMPRCGSPLRSKVEPDSPRSLKRSLRVVNKSADTLSKISALEIPVSAFCNADVAALGHRDEGFSEPSPFREEAYRILDGTIFSEPDVVIEPTSPIPQATPRAASPTKETTGRRSRRPTPSTTDSGYSSGGSFRKTARETTEDTTRATSRNPPAKGVVAEILRSEGVPEAHDRVSLYDFEQMLALPISQKPLPPIPTEEIFPNAPTALPESWERAVDSHLVRLQVSAQTTTSVSASVPPSPVPPQIQIPAATHQWSWERTTTKRLQRRRLSLPDLPPPVVQSCPPTPDGTIPSVPEPVKSKFVRRLSDAPEMECLTRTYLSKDHTNSEEPTVDPPTTFSSGSTSPYFSFEPRPRHHRRAHTERPSTPPLAMKRTQSIFSNRSQTNKQREGHREADIAMNVVDLGTIGSALGRSPYDAAMSTLPKKAATTPTHPHQLGTPVPRTKSMVSMDAETATEFARMRSKERAQARPEVPRPQSYHDAGFEMSDVAQLPRTSYGSSPEMCEVGTGTTLHSHDTSTTMEEEPTPTRPRLGIRTRSTGRGPVVTQLVEKYDSNDSQASQPQQDSEPQVDLFSQSRLPFDEEDLDEQLESPESDLSHTVEQATTEPPKETKKLCDRDTLPSLYQRRMQSTGGSAANRHLHSAASRTNNHHLSNQFGLDLTDVPVLLQRS